MKRAPQGGRIAGHCIVRSVAARAARTKVHAYKRFLKINSRNYFKEFTAEIRPRDWCIPSSSWQFSSMIPFSGRDPGWDSLASLFRSSTEWLNMVAQSSMSRCAPQPSSL